MFEFFIGPWLGLNKFVLPFLCRITCVELEMSVSPKFSVMAVVGLLGKSLPCIILMISKCYNQ